MAESPNRVEEIYYTAVQKPSKAERLAYLDAACGDDSALRGRVEELLKANDGAGDFLEAPAFDVDVTLDTSPVVEGPGSVIGPYKLLEKIGEGGMAVVYMAEQERPLQRRVALKIIKLGMDTRSVIARFEIEREALAMMDHPNIARVFDAGSTETGRPYFVMELVRGVSITEYCDMNKLDASERLELFVPVCHAVQHAHQKGIIHRDIKPSNIMVTLHDGIPVPKVIDFGIAKATNQRLTERTIFTRYAELIGTPEYMSPEQAEMSCLDIDTRTDVYSLGVVLYELLTGALPFDEGTLRSAALGEIQRIIREVEPPRPSTRLSALGERARKIAESRRTDTATLTRRLRSELEWIPLKALRKDRTRRYRSVSELADDVQSYLNGRPLIAGPESAAYRFRKFLGRHRAPVVLTSTIILTLVAGLSIVANQHLQVRQAQSRVTSLTEQVEMDRQLSTAQRLYAEGSYQAALAQIESSLLRESPQAKTRLLYAQILSDVGRGEEAEEQLQPLLDQEAGTAGAAHCLLARIYLGTDREKSRQHQEQADALTPQTADAFSLRAMTSGSLDVALDWLSKAVQLDPSHYPTRKARALAYYASRDYANMEQESEILIAMRPRDSLGYSLRAIARRHRQKYREAIADHARAIELCAMSGELPIQYAQRGETYERMGGYRAALQDAQRCMELDPNDRGAYCREFACLVALGDFDGAKRVYESTGSWTEWHRTQFTQWIQKHVLDVLAAGQSLDLPAAVAGQPPFSTMREAIDMYRRMEQKARRFLPSVYGTATWSPDGKRLAFGRSDRYAWMHTRLLSQSDALSTSTGIEILDLDSGESRLLVYSGTDPAWSPDGRYIAFLRCPGRYLVLREELWIVPAEGGEPRRLASGGCPFWSPDSKTLFFRQMKDNYVYSIRIDDPRARPQRVVAFPSSEPTISPDAKYVGFGCGSDFRIVEIASGATVDGWFSPVPEAWGGLHGRWSADGKEIILCSTSGVWIFDTHTGEARHVFPEYVDGAELSPDRSRLAFRIAIPKEELWLACIDPNRPIYESLAPALTREDFLRRYVLEEAGRRLPRDPNDADAHLAVALAQVLLGNHAEAATALQRFNASDQRNCMIDGISWQVKQQRIERLRPIRELTRFGETQYLTGRYKEALQTLEGAVMLRQGAEGQSDPQAVALLAMSHYKLGHHSEARMRLAELRRTLDEDESPYASKWLCETEQLLSQEDRRLWDAWTAIAAGRLEDATKLLRALETSRRTDTPEDTANLKSVRTALGSAYRARGKQAALSGGYKYVIADYEAAAALSPDHASLFSDLGWLLASCPAAELRDGPQALIRATRACELTGWKSHRSIAILAAVYARLSR
jgi:serine/threonine protein kinase